MKPLRVAYRRKLLDNKPHVETDAMKDSRLRSLYRETFRQDNDIIVLFDILNECGFFSMHVKGENDLAKQNVARFILHRVGAWQEFNGPNVVRALMNIPHERN